MKKDASIKKLPTGIESFSKIIKDNYYYVDKTNLIKDLLNSKSEVTLFTRPRRFGKSLNMDMLKAFFIKGTDISLFDGLAISNEKALCEKYQGEFPVISISLKDVGGVTFEDFISRLRFVIFQEIMHFDWLMDSGKLAEYDKTQLNQLLLGKFEGTVDLQGSLKFLSGLLYKHYGKKVIVLIDEYDVPLDKAYQNGYYPQMVNLIRFVFSQLLKTNENLEFAVITGCLQIARESIFTGLNNFKIRTVSDIRFAEHFGFTDAEVKKLLDYYHLGDKFELFKEWYDGYHFGNVHVYCPWDVINQCDKFCESGDARMESHWENSSSNSIVKDILENSTETTRIEIEALISGECVEKPLISGLTYSDFDSREPQKRQAYLWSILFSTGYLTDAGQPVGKVHRLAIPNREVFEIYQERIRAWFETKTVSNTQRWQRFCTAVREGDKEAVQALFNSFLSDSISIRDTYIRKEMKENFYHGMLLGLMRAEESWIVKSNVESGIGYTDIVIMAPSEQVGCVMEVKYAENGAFDTACSLAMKQIEEGGYVTLLKQEGMQKIHKFGIACYKKSCSIAYEEG